MKIRDITAPLLHLLHFLENLLESQRCAAGEVASILSLEPGHSVDGLATRVVAYREERAVHTASQLKELAFRMMRKFKPQLNRPLKESSKLVASGAMRNPFQRVIINQGLDMLLAAHYSKKLDA